MYTYRAGPGQHDAPAPSSADEGAPAGWETGCLHSYLEAGGQQVVFVGEREANVSAAVGPLWDPVGPPMGPPMEPLWDPYGTPMGPLWDPYDDVAGERRHRLAPRRGRECFEGLPGEGERQVVIMTHHDS